MHHDLLPDPAGARRLYDLLLHDNVVASVVRNGSRQPYTWTAELLEALPRSRRPAPLREIEHDFTSLDELCAWLGHPTVKTNNRHYRRSSRVGWQPLI